VGIRGNKGENEVRVQGYVIKGRESSNHRERTRKGKILKLKNTRKWQDPEKRGKVEGENISSKAERGG